MSKKSKKVTTASLAAMVAVSSLAPVVAPITTSAATETAAEAFSYMNMRDYVRIIGYKGASPDVVIPATIEGLPVTIVNITGKQLNSVDLSQAVSLTNVVLDENQLKSVNVGILPNLKSLSVRNNKLTTLNLGGATSLNTLTTYGNPFTAVTRSAFPAINNATVKDTTPPEAIINSPGGNVSQAAKVLVTAKDDFEVTKIEYAWTPTATEPTSWTNFTERNLQGVKTENVEIPVPQTNGKYYLHVRAYDVKGTVSTSTVSATPFQIVHPLDIKFSDAGHETYKRQHTVGYELTMPVDSVSYGWSNSGEVKPTSFTPGSQKGTAVTPTETGPQVLWVRAMKEGVEYIFNSVTFAVDATSPLLSVSTGSPAVSGTGQSVAVNVAANDALSGISTIKFAPGKQTAAYFGTQGYDVLGGAFNVSENGTYTVYAKDRAGNETVQTVEVSSIDSTKPVISVSMDGNTTAAKSHKTIVNATDDVRVDKLEYVWATSPDLPNGAKFTGISPGTTVETPANAKGNQYLHVRAVDNAGNVTTFVSKPFNVDGVATGAPTLQVLDLAITKDNVQVSMTLPAGAVRGEYKIGEEGKWQAYTGPFTVTENVTVYGRAYNTADVVSPMGEVAVTNIDRVKPVISLSKNGNTELAKFHPVVVNAKDDQVLATVEYAWSKSKSATGLTYTQTKAGSTLATPNNQAGDFYLHVRATDHVGNTSTFVSELFRVDDTTIGAPVLQVGDLGATNGDVQVSMILPKGAVRAEYKIGETGTWTSYVNPFKVSENAKIFGRSYNAVNAVSPIGELEVTNIDRVNPVINVSKKGSANLAKSHSVTVTASDDKFLSKLEYVWAKTASNVGLTYEQVETGAVVTTPSGQDGDYYLHVRAVDHVGNTSTFVSEAFKVDDKLPGAPDLQVVDFAPTKGDVQVSMTLPTGGVRGEYKIGENGTWQAYSTPFTVKENVTVYGRSYNAVNAVSPIGDVAVTNIDRVKPVISLSVNGNPELATSHSAVINATDDKILATVEYAWVASPDLPKGTEFTTVPAGTKVETPAGVKGNYYLHVRATDHVGNTSTFASELFKVDDKTPGAPTLQVVDLAVTKGDVKVSMELPSGGVRGEYKIGEDGTWKAYTEPFTVAENIKVFGRSYNAVNAVSPVGEVVVSNIDRDKPLISLSTNGNTELAKAHSVVVNAYDSKVLSKLEYAWSKSKSPEGLKYTQTKTGAVVTTPSGQDGDYYLHVRATDHVGNTNEFVSELFRVDDTAPGAPVLKLNTESPTKDEVKVTIEYPEDAVTREYRIGNNGEWLPYNGPISVADNAIVYARSFNAADVVSPIGMIAVGNIDKMNPIIQLSQTQNEAPSRTHEAKITVTDNQAVGKVQYAWSTDNKTAPLKFTDTQNGATVGTPEDSGVYYLWVKAEDEASNVSTTVSGGFLVATTPPALDIAFSSKTPTQTPITLTATPRDNTLGAKVIKVERGTQTLDFFATGGTDISQTRSTTITENGVYTFYVEDLIGNKSIQQVVVSTIDKTGSVVQLSQNGNAIYAASHSTTVYVTDEHTVGNVMYGWSTNPKVEPESFTAIENSTEVVTPPSGETYYLWVKTKDAAGNETTFVSQAFNTKTDDFGEVPTCETVGGECSSLLLVDGDVTTVKTTVNGGKDYVKVDSTHISYEIPLERDADVWEITVSYDKSNNENIVEINVLADGQVVSTFKKPALISVRDTAFDHVGRLTEVDTRLYATPHRKYPGEGIQFHAYVTHHVYKLYNGRKTFADIQTSYAKTAIEELASRKIVNGVSETAYAPDVDMTRGQFAAILGRSLGKISSKAAPFTDIQGNIFEEEIKLLSELGLVNGVTGTYYDVNATLTREQAVTILNRTLDLYGYTNNPANTRVFTDMGDVSEYAVTSVNRLAALGVIDGMPDGSFQPQGNVTRAQMAKMLWNVLLITELY